MNTRCCERGAYGMKSSRQRRQNCKILSKIRASRTFLVKSACGRLSGRSSGSRLNWAGQMRMLAGRAAVVKRPHQLLDLLLKRNRERIIARHLLPRPDQFADFRFDTRTPPRQGKLPQHVGVYFQIHAAALGMTVEPASRQIGIEDPRQYVEGKALRAAGIFLLRAASEGATRRTYPRAFRAAARGSDGNARGGPRRSENRRVAGPFGAS